MRDLAVQLRRSAFVKVPKLIETIFGGADIDRIAEEVFVDLVTQGIYIPTVQGTADAHRPPASNTRKRKREQDSNPSDPRWRDLPLELSTENDIHAPLSAILNKITALTRRRVHDTFDITWRDEYSQWNDEHKAFEDVKPDIVATLLPKRLGKKEEHKIDIAVWWQFAHTVVVIKQQHHQEPGSLYLFYWARRMLIEQPDRRFVFGLFFSKRSLSAWLIDRSGVLGSCAFDVHEDPHSLIRVVVGLLLKNPSELGWDPTMLTYVEDSSGHPVEPIPSYELLCAQGRDLAAYAGYERGWVVEMNVPGQGDEPHATTERFILFRPLSISGREVIGGRSTQVWLAWKWNDVLNAEIAKKDRKVYVFKDCWRDKCRAEEGKLYDTAGKGEPVAGVVSVYSYGTVRLNGEVDNTRRLIRQLVSPRRSAEPLRLRSDRLWVVEQLWAEKRDITKLPEDVVEEVFAATFEDYPVRPVNRIHSQLVMSTFGWPLHKFKSLFEFVGALHDAIAGHKHLYENGVLHHDINYYNILITSLPAPNRGVLIDLDNAIPTPVEGKDLEEEPHGTLAFMSFEVIKKEEYFEWVPPVSVNESEDHLSLSGNATESTQLEEVPVQRHVIHDLESVLGMICYICMSHEGPARRRTLHAANSYVYRRRGPTNVDEAIAACFLQEDANLAAFTKHALMRSPGRFAGEILAYFSSYFAPLVGLASDLYAIVRKAYRTERYTGVHDKFLMALKKVEEDPSTQAYHDNHPEYQAMEQAEITRRTDDRESWEIPAQRIPIAPHRGTKVASSTTPSNEVKEVTSSTHNDQSSDHAPAGPSASKRRRTIV